MKALNFVLEDYLTRIQFTEKPAPNQETLRALMLHQLRFVPFENLDVQAGKIVSLVPEDIVSKIVYKNRGGYCYEVNGLFAMVLEALGIKYRFIAARPMFYPVKRPKTHMAILATLNDEDWLIDLGFGSYGICEPMLLSQLNQDIRQGHDTYLLSKLEDQVFLLQAKVEGTWKNQYSFDLSEQDWIDFVPANYLNSTHPDSVFVQKLLIISHIENGRKILFGDSLKIIEYGSIKEEFIPPNAIAKTLLNHFKLKL